MVRMTIATSRRTIRLIDMDSRTSIGFQMSIVAVKELDAEVMDGFKSLSGGKKNFP